MRLTVSYPTLRILSMALLVLFSVSHALRASASIDWSMVSIDPEKGMSISPGMFSFMYSKSGLSHLLRLRMYSCSARLTSTTAGLAVSKWSVLRNSTSLPDHSAKRISFVCSTSWIFSRCSRSSFIFWRCLRACSRWRVTVWMSLARSSPRIVSRSRTGSTESCTCVIASSSKARTTWKMPSTSEMCERNWLPRPAPVDAPAMSPAMS
eukprot:Amastigsp_a508459_1135.p2 type:complete len:208 gc:universal Amastigsp_a508459_1135:291-914(+)